MSVEFRASTRPPAPGFQELDNVVLLAPAVTDDGDTIPAGTAGTIVGVWSNSDCIVEFSEPEGALATVSAASIVIAEPSPA